MNCRETGEHLMDIAAGLPAAPEMAAHLQTCAACAGSLERMRQTMALLDEWKAPEVSPYFDVRLKARLREEAATSRGWMEWFRKPALAASIAALLVIGGALFSHPVSVVASPGAAVRDLQALEKNHDLFANFDLLDDLADNDVQTANP